MALGGLGHEIAREALLLPALVAAAVALGLGWLLRERALPVALAIALGFLMAFEPIRGLEPAWPHAAADKLPWLALLGLAMTLFAERRRRPLVGAAVVVLGAVGLVASRELALGRIAAPALVALAGLALWQVTRRSGGPPWRRHWTLAAIGFSLAGVALFARTVLIAELALACSAALLATAVRPAASPEAFLPGLAVLLGLATTLALFSEASVVALALSGAIALAGWASLHLAPRVRVPEPLLFVGLGTLAAALATGWTRWLEGPPLYVG